MTTTDDLGLPNSKTPDVNYLNAQQDRWDERVAKISDGLRRLADEVDRAGKPNRTRGDFVNAAADVVHAISWGVANLNSGLLVNTAGDVHRAREAATSPND